MSKESIFYYYSPFITTSERNIGLLSYKVNLLEKSFQEFKVNKVDKQDIFDALKDLKQRIRDIKQCLQDGLQETEAEKCIKASYDVMFA